MKKNIHFLLGILLSLTIVLSACSGTTQQPKTDTTETKQTADEKKEEKPEKAEKTTEAKTPVTLTVSWWGTDTRHAALQSAIDRFMQTYDWIKVESTFSGWDGYHDKLTVQLSTGNAPDLFAFGRGFAQQYGAGDTLINYLDYSASLPYFSEIQANLKNPYQTVNGRVIGLSTGISTLAVLYNKKHFDAAGVEYPSDNESWVSLSEKWQKVHAALPEIYGDNGWMYMPDIFPLMMKQLGQEIYDVSADPAKVTIDFDAANKIWSWNEALWENGTIARDSSDTIGFEAGNLASALSASSVIPNTKNQTEDPLGFAVIPKTFDGSGKKIANPPVPGGLWGIPSSSKHIDEALMLLNFLQTDPEAVKAIGTQFGVPSVPSSLKLLQDNLEAGSLEYEMLDLVQRSQADIDEIWSLPMPKGYSQALEAYQVEMERYIFHDIDKDTFIKNAQEVMNQAIISAD